MNNVDELALVGPNSHFYRVTQHLASRFKFQLPKDLETK